MSNVHQFPTLRECYTPADVEPREREPRIVDQGSWEPVSNRFLSYGFFMFCCGCLAAWAFIAAWQI